jgi:hypothetical protein
VDADPGSGGPDNPANPAGPAVPQGVAYEAAAPNAYQWTEVAYDYLVDGKLTASITSAGGISTATVTGTCPYCADDVNFSEVLDAVTGESIGTLGWRRLRPAPAKAGVDYVPLTVSCSCTVQHPGRPAGVPHGCGINFKVEVLRGA